MKEIRLNILLIAIVCSISLILADVDRFEENEAYCYKFRWTPTLDSEPGKNNCTSQKGVVCIEPLYPGHINVTELWDSKNKTSFCSLSTGDVCLKHTVTFNNELVNQSFFCGKVIEDQTTTITSGCYQDTKEGYTIEICACRSRRGAEPCNASISIKYINFVLLIVIFVCIHIY